MSEIPPVPPDYSVASVTAALLAIIRGYLTHLEPSTSAAANVLRLEASGPSFSLTLDQRGGAPATLSVTLQGLQPGAALVDLPPDGVEKERGRFGRG